MPQRKELEARSAVIKQMRKSALGAVKWLGGKGIIEVASRIRDVGESYLHLTKGGVSASPLLRFLPAVDTGCIDEGEDGQPRTPRHRRRAQGIAATLGQRHAEVAVDLLLGVATIAAVETIVDGVVHSTPKYEPFWLNPSLRITTSVFELETAALS